jgi:hypothetical protein
MSTQVQINDVPPKTQITATAGQTVFTTNWTANAASDVVVYARTSAQTPDDLTQLVSNANYTVAFVGGSEIVQVTFLVARALGDVITITRDTPADRLNLYTNTNFTPSMLNQDVGILTLVDQQAQLYNNQVAPHYNVSSTPDLGDTMTGEGGDIYLPILGANEAWKKNSSNTAIEAITFPTSGGLAPSDATYILQTPWSPSGELPNSQALSPLATGFMSSVTATGVVSTRTLQGTTNQINVTNGTGTGNPVFSLSSSLQLPGTMTFGGNVDANGYNISNIGQANIGNIQISSNSIISTNTNGNINLTPNGTGNLVLDGLNWPQADGTNGQAVTTNGSGQLGWTSFGAPYTASALTSTSDTNVTITLGGNPSTALLQATSITMGWSGQLPIARGGTNNSVLGANGTLAQSDGTKYTFTTATYPGTATSTNKILRADGTNWVASTNAQLSASDALTGLTNLQVDDVTIDGDTISTNTVNGNLYLEPNGTGHVDVGDPGLEVGNILIDGIAFNSRFRVNDIGNTAPAMVTIHKHSTTQEPLQIAARSNSDTSAHATVTANMPLYSMYATGWLNSYYGIFGQIRFSADSSGTLADGSAPGKMELMVTPNGAVIPVTAMTIINNGNVSFAANIVSGTWQASTIAVGYGGTGLSSTPTNGQLLIGNGSGYTLSTLTAGPGISIANASGSITISGTGSGIGWTEVTGTSQTMAADNGYVSSNPALVTLTLPATAAFGTAITVLGKGAGGWKIAQGAGQQIHFGSVSSTAGATGYLSSTNQYDSIQLICITANNEWACIGAQGNITVA